MLPRVLPLLLAPFLGGCGAPVWLPTEPPAVGSVAPVDTAETGLLDTALPADVPCSGYGSAPVSLEVVNLTDGPIALLWVDFGCAEVPYGQIPAGGSYVQQTFDTHVWLIRDGAGDYLDHVVLDATPAQTLEVP